jgi:hypothetical protein
MFAQLLIGEQYKSTYTRASILLLVSYFTRPSLFSKTLPAHPLFVGGKKVTTSCGLFFFSKKKNKGREKEGARSRNKYGKQR